MEKIRCRTMKQASRELSCLFSSGFKNGSLTVPETNEYIYIYIYEKKQ